MAVRIVGSRYTDMSRDKEGYRHYHITIRIESDSPIGPATALSTSGLPQYGDSWDFYGEVDDWCYCRLDTGVAQVIRDGEPTRFYDLTYHFTNQPDEKRCHELQIDNPIDVPDRVSFSFTRYVEEATEDRFGNKILNSAFEMVRGPQVEFDKNRIVVKIEQNRTDAQLDLLAALNDHVNGVVLWGFPTRTIKLTVGTITKNFYAQCSVYYTRTLEFEIRTDTLDRNILDEGTKALNGHWSTTTGAWILDNINGVPPDSTNPSHFIRLQDKQGNPMRGVLDGGGIPIGDSPGTGSHTNPGNIHVEYYNEFGQSDIDALTLPDIP